MARKDLLSEAIADAKAVKETALANAKLALEEAFTPKLQSMISAKLAEELDDEELEEDEMGLEDELEEDDMEVEDEPEMGVEDEYEDELEEDEMGLEDELEEDEDEDIFEHEDEDLEEEDDDLDLESIIRELEMGDDEELDGEELGEDEEVEDEDDGEETVDLEEVIRVLKEMGDDEEVEDEVEDEELAADLEEAYATIESLQETINEVNLLNAKLLYTNKLFRTFDLNETQKVKVLENFDRTSSVREVKLVFSTIAENLNVSRKKRAIVKEGYASKVTKSSAPSRKIISEGNAMATRWKKLAGLK
tara:strand:- start:288 stop:1205 length:918 start_codon:yes stop_codon:yes gene_type:complete